MTDGLFSLLNYNHNDSSIITIGSVTGVNGVTIIDGYIAPFEGSQQNAEASLSSSLLLGIPGIPYSITDIQVGSTTVNGTSPGNNTFRNPSSNLGRPFEGPYINFTEPFSSNFSGNYSYGDHFRWIYSSYSSSTNYTSF